MTYYGRWTYKYEIASEKGAAAAILVHETGPAGYPFEVVRGSWSRENFDIAQPDAGQAPSRVAVEGWIALDKAKELFQACGQDFEALKQAAARPRFPAGAARLQREVRHHEHASRGQVAQRGRQARGVGSLTQGRERDLHGTLGPPGPRPVPAGDQIYNGAADNASGVAGVLEIARALAQVKPPAQAIDRVPGRHGRGERIARRQVLRGTPALSPRAHASPTSTST